MIIESGLIIFFGLLFIFVKLPKRITLRMLGRPLLLDLFVSTVVYILHWGTFTGVMAAAFAGMMTSLFTTMARHYYGYIIGTRYYPGMKRINIEELRNEPKKGHESGSGTTFGR